MIAPFYKMGMFGYNTSLVIAFIIGILFGYTLERAGFADSRKLAHQFYFRDMAVLKVMFTAVVVAMLGLLYLNLANIVDISRVYFNPTYLTANILGGLIMGFGFVIGGFCPGTSLIAGVIGRIDGLLYVAGALFGMFIYGEVYPHIEKIANGGAMGRRFTLSDWLHLRPGVVAFMVTLMALFFFWGGDYLTRKFTGQEKKAGPATSSKVKTKGAVA